MNQNTSARTRLARTVLEARRTRAGLPPSRLRGLGGLGSFGSFSAAPLAVPAAWQIDPSALRALASGAQAGNVPTAVLQPKPSAAPAVAAQAPQAVAATRKAWTSAGLPAAINFRGLRGGRLGAFGFSPQAGEAASQVGSKAGAAGAGALASELGASAAVAGPIGIAAGIVIALAVSLFTKHYFNVGDSNAACAQLEALWQKYTGIQGHVAGRALGWQTMNQLMHAATGAGLFPGNNMHLSFHEGTLQCAGHGDWVDTFTGSSIQGNPGPACGAHNCLPDAYQAYLESQSQIPQGTPDAVYLVDNILLPMNAPGKAQIPWIYQGAQNAEVHQLLYDLADAYIASKGGNSTPYVEYPAAQIGTPTANAESAPVAPAPTATAPAAPGATPVQVGTDPNGVAVYQVPGQSGYYEVSNGQLVPYAGALASAAATQAAQAGATPTQASTDPTTGLPFYTVPGQSGYFQIVNGQLQPYAPSASVASNAGYAPIPSAPTVAPAGSTAAISTGSPLGGMSPGTLALLGGSVIGIYLITEMMDRRKKRAKSHG